jgi:hypothetical protein
MKQNVSRIFGIQFLCTRENTPFIKMRLLTAILMVTRLALIGSWEVLVASIEESVMHAFGLSRLSHSSGNQTIERCLLSFTLEGNMRRTPTRRSNDKTNLIIIYQQAC